MMGFLHGDSDFGARQIVEMPCRERGCGAGTIAEQGFPVNPRKRIFSIDEDCPLL
jgi:hypothetical protein